jgi:hypothetical protein
MDAAASWVAAHQSKTEAPQRHRNSRGLALHVAEMRGKGSHEGGVPPPSGFLDVCLALQVAVSGVRLWCLSFRAPFPQALEATDDLIWMRWQVIPCWRCQNLAKVIEQLEANEVWRYSNVMWGFDRLCKVRLRYSLEKRRRRRSRKSREGQVD